MSIDLYEIDETRGNAVSPAQQTETEKFVLTDEFFAIPAYKEILPDGLISDEI